MEDKENKNVRKMYRSREEIMKSKEESRGKRNKDGWFRKKKYNAGLRIENTPGGRLAKKVKESIRSDPDLKCMKILVLEKNGSQLAGMSNHIDPHVADFCNRKDCFPCRTADKPTWGNCWREGAA